jgi:hypothetical protein
MAKTKKQQLGHLPPQYHFSLNPYPDLRFSSCPIVAVKPANYGDECPNE